MQRCEAAIALKLGADQSFVGVVRRISRTEYAVQFQIRDAHTGAIILARQSDLRIGADYSGSRRGRADQRSSLLEIPECGWRWGRLCPAAGVAIKNLLRVDVKPDAAVFEHGGTIA
jgi:hypothetical protein